MLRRERAFSGFQEMGRFLGTIAEFKRNIGPRIRNEVQRITKTERKRRIKCDNCSEDRPLEAAHIRGRSRQAIIDLHLASAINQAGILDCDLDEMVQKIIADHQPIEKSFLFLCSQCHGDYDRDEKRSSPKIARAYKLSPSKFEGVLPISLVPADNDEFRRLAISKGVATIYVTYADGSMKKRLWQVSRLNAGSNVLGNLRSRPEFRQGNWQDAGIVELRVEV